MTTPTPLHPRLLALAAELGGPLLAFDTSGPSASICAVGFGREAVTDAELPAASMPSESLAATLVQLLDEAGVDAATLRGIVIGLGPGSFTGLRVGLATAKGLALGADVPVFGVSSLAMLAASHGPGLVAPVLDARRNEVFAALYDVAADGSVEALLEDGAYAPATLATHLEARGSEAMTLVGGGVATCLSASERPGWAIREEPTLYAGYGILHAASRLRSGQHDPIDRLAPLYMKASEAERQLGG